MHVFIVSFYQFSHTLVKGNHENMLLSFTYFFVLTISNITKRKANQVIIRILIWFFFTSFGRKECNLTIKNLKHVQKAYICIILQRECAPPLSTLNQFQLRPIPWSEIARFEIGGAIYILIIGTSFFFFIYFYSIRLLLHKHMLLQLMQPSKTTLNLPSSSLHLCSPLQEIRRVKIHHQFTSFPK